MNDDIRRKRSGHSPNIERYTPASIFEGLGVVFDLDPCAPRSTHCPSKNWCTRHYSLPDDGLALEWDGKVFVNPPFTRGEVGKWIGKLRQHGDGIALVTSYFTSRWFQDNPPDGLLLLAQRPRYEVPKSDSSTLEGRYPSMLMSYGAACTGVLRRARLEGQFYVGERNEQ